VQELELRASVPAPIEDVWRAFTDHAGWQRWAGFKEVVLRQPGDPPPNGLGAIRVLRHAGVAIEEEVTAFEPPARLAYRVVAGLPLRDHHAEVRFSAEPAGTAVLWSVRFRPLVPGTGWLLRRAVTHKLADILHRLQSTASPPEAGARPISGPADR
jgi:uncharacterized protein YndB with AHSA1/START domain